MSDLIEMYTGKKVNLTADEMFMERAGKVENMEVYSSNTVFLMMFPNDYTLIARMKSEYDKRVRVEVYYGVGDVTLDFFKKRKLANKAKKCIVEALANKLEALPKVEVTDEV